MRSRHLPFLLAVAATVLLVCASPAAAQLQRSLAMPREMIAGPSEDTFVRQLPLRVALRLPAGTSNLRVRLGRRDIASRFRPAGGTRRVARLTTGDGLRYGTNRLVVRAERRAGRPVIHARSLIVGRSAAGLVRLRVRPGPVTSLSAVLAAPSALSTIRRSRTVRLWVNGRPATRALNRSRLTRFTAKLSAAHGLRYGVNRLRMLVAEPEPGRYAVVRRRFVLRRTRHLAAAGWDVHTRAGRRHRLDGGRSRTAGRAQPRLRWKIVKKPRRSRASLRRPGSVRPLLRTDRPGRYVVRLALSERSKPGELVTAAQASRVSTDRITLTAAPAPLQKFRGITSQNGQHGVQVGSTFYPNRSPNGAALQWLTLDRRTLSLAKPSDNNWLDGTGSGEHGVSQLAGALGNQGLNQLVILSFPYGASAPPVQPDQNDAFNAAMKMIGVGPIDSGILGDRNKLAILGVPGGGDGSGWYTHGGGAVDGLTGWLMPDRTTGFRFQPSRPTFNTSSASTPTTNTMTLTGQRIDAALPAGATGGLSVVALNPIDFTVADQRVFATNGVGDPAGAINAVADYLNASPGGYAGNHLVVQSIGRVARPAPPSDPYQDDLGLKAWLKLGQALARYGANPNTLSTVNGSYSYVGGPLIERTEVAESSSAVVTDPTSSPPTTEPGTLRGRMSIRSDGYYLPAPSSPANTLDSLYDMTFRPATYWPFTGPATGDQADPAAYRKALAYITSCLPQTKAYTPDLRQAYSGDLNRDWAATKTDLSDLRYPGDDACKSADQNPGFSRAQFDTLKAELQLEFDWLNDVKKLFDAYEKTLNRSNAKGEVDLQSLGSAVQDDVNPPNEDLLADIGNLVLMLAEDAALFATVPEGGAPLELAVTEALAAAYEAGMSLTQDARSGAPLGRQVDKKVDDLAQEAADKLESAVNSLDSLRGVVVSDYGRLKALGTAAATPEWVVNVDQLAKYLTVSANGWFSSELFPVAYRVWYLSPSFSWSDVQPNSCYLFGYGRSWRDADTSSWLRWQAPFEGQSNRGGDVLALSKRSWSASQDAFPDKALTNRTFGPMSRGGYGVALPDFVWTRFKAPYPYVNCYK